MEYHPLKWISQPEFIFALVYKVTHDFIEGVDDVLQSLIDKARFCKIKLQAWSDDVLLLGLGIDENGMNRDINGHMMKTSGFFDEEIKSFYELETSWLMEMIAHIICQFDTLSYEHFYNLHWFDCLLKDVDRLPAMNAILSVDLVEALDNLRSPLLFFRQHLNPTDFLDLWRSVANGLDHFITSDVRLPDGEDRTSQLGAYHWHYGGNSSS
ncbi:hypothetical protein Nepgr_001458 [Nepenthes gracilis]|uniref:Uncharacterized protein n=1 Tax=Nepenthes gracilis TaxID=150966 RepID=A0AAD3P8A0_NEPGR|nr:hypothetical protein Nepgr_001458 [Nepenthes gracilis]